MKTQDEWNRKRWDTLKVPEIKSPMERAAIEFPKASTPKKEKDRMMHERELLPKETMKHVESSPFDDINIRQATLSAAVSPFLQAIIVIGETDSHYFISVYQSLSEPLSKDELIGALSLAGEEKVIALKEENKRKFIKIPELFTMIKDEVEHLHLKNISLVSIHHDYVRYFNEGKTNLEEVLIYHLLQNGNQSVSKVISKV